MYANGIFTYRKKIEYNESMIFFPPINLIGYIANGQAKHHNSQNQINLLLVFERRTLKR